MTDVVKRRARYRARYARMRAAGLCGCGRPAREGRARCEHCCSVAAARDKGHLAERVAQERERREQLVAARLCVRCKADVGANGRHCGGCLERVRAETRARYARRRAAGVCIRCEAPAAVGADGGTEVFCEACRDRSRAWQRATAKRRRADVRAELEDFRQRHRGAA